MCLLEKSTQGTNIQFSVAILDQCQEVHQVSCCVGPLKSPAKKSLVKNPLSVDGWAALHTSPGLDSQPHLPLSTAGGTETVLQVS